MNAYCCFSLTKEVKIDFKIFTVGESQLKTIIMYEQNSKGAWPRIQIRGLHRSWQGRQPRARPFWAVALCGSLICRQTKPIYNFRSLASSMVAGIQECVRWESLREQGLIVFPPDSQEDTL